MHYSKINKTDIANGPGVRVSLFVSGCRRHCEGCFNPETWDFENGEKYTQEVEDRIIKALSPEWIRGLSILGGEPFEEENWRTLENLVTRVKKELPDKDIWIYSGYKFEELKGNPLLAKCDVLVDGEFIDDKKQAGLAYKGSANQRIIEIPRSFLLNGICLWENRMSEELWRTDEIL